MKRFALLAIACFSMSSCVTVRLTSDYDEVIDKGIAEFTEQLNAHLKNMAELGGTTDGTYEATLRIYNQLDAKIDILIERATNASDGKACKLEAALFTKVSAILKDNAPPELQTGTGASIASESACNARLLTLVKDQLAFIREIHKTTDKCGGLSCIRPATAQDALAIANQSCNAVSVVESARKSL